MIHLADSLLAWIDGFAERSARKVAQNAGRRSFLAKAGTLMLGGALAPMLPYDRSDGAAYAATADGDASVCEYWRYCALDGNICSACGGSITQCPPGSSVSKVSWVGTCRNPNDGRTTSSPTTTAAARPSATPPPSACRPKASVPATAWGFTTTSTGAWPTPRRATTARGGAGGDRGMRLALIAAVLLASSPGVGAAADGKAVFAEVCTACHQEGGKGAPGLAPPLVDPALWSRLGAKAADYVTGVLISGLSGQIEANGELYVGLVMPSQTHLSDEEIVAVAEYVLNDLNGLGVTVGAPPRAHPPGHKALRTMRAGGS